MRFPIAALFFVVLLFIAFVGYCVSSFMLYTIDESLTSVSGFLGSSESSFLANLDVINLGFGVAMVIFFLVIVVVFIVDSLRYEPEQYQY